MSFVSYSFLLFLPSVFVLYWALAKRLFPQNLLIVAASYIFYGWWDWRFLLLIFITSFSSYLSGLALETGRWRRMVATSNIVLNLGILAVFKYYDFFLDNLQTAMSPLGISFDLPTLHLILPVGISFYTFQSLSYTIDVYRQKIAATKDIVAFFAFVSFFPQLVAGPIERATHLLPQMLVPRTFDYTLAVDGLRRMLWGFFKKMVVADNCAIAVNIIWSDWQGLDSFTLLVGMLLFTFQIYGDFSGYSDIAIGTSQLFGIRLCDNFRLPYFSRSVHEFWRRWHISLMSWFRDYVYIPLGGNRVPRWKVARNIIIVFFLSGLWHGANWTFVVWGLYSAVLMTPLIWLGRDKAREERLVSFTDLPRVLPTFLLVAIGWVVFRSESLEVAVGYLGRMFTAFDANILGNLSLGKTALAWCVVLVILEWVQRAQRHVLELPTSGVFRKRAFRWFVYYVLLMVIIFFHGEEQAFIYFQF